MNQPFGGASAPVMSSYESAVRAQIGQHLIAIFGHARDTQRIYDQIKPSVIYGADGQPVNVAALVGELGLARTADRIAGAFETSDPASAGVTTPYARQQPSAARASEFEQLQKLEAAGALTAGQRIALGLARAAAEQAAHDATTTAAEGGDA